MPRSVRKLLCLSLAHLILFGTVFILVSDPWKEGVLRAIPLVFLILVFRFSGNFFLKDQKSKGFWTFSTFPLSLLGFGFYLYLAVQKKQEIEFILGFFIAYFLSLLIFVFITRNQVCDPPTNFE